MDIRVLRYFLAIAREESFSRAAEALHLTQPTLSRQIRDLEDELGVQLFERSSHAVLLTRDGLRLRKRAQELIDLMQRTEEEFSASADDLSGDVYLGSGETDAMRIIARVAVAVHRAHPGIRFHLYSGNAEDVIERLDRGLLDFGLLIQSADIRKYDSLPLPGSDVWGVLMRTDHPLAQQDAVAPRDLADVPLLISRQEAGGDLRDWTAQCGGALNVVGTYNLVYNAAIMVEEGLGCALTLDHLVDMTVHRDLVFRPLAPRVQSDLNIVWKKYPVFSPAAEFFLQRLRETLPDTP